MAEDARLSPRRHGGNKDEQAQSLQDWLDAAGDAVDGEYHPCSYARHRPSDWVSETSPLQCGICHPPAPGVMFVRRGDPPFDELAAAAIARMTARRVR